MRLLKKSLLGRSGTFAEVHFPFAQPLTQALRGDIHELKFVRQIQYRIRDGLLHRHTRDLANGVRSALDVLDVKRSENIDTCFEQLDDVLVSLRMPRPDRVRMRQLIHHYHLRATSEDRFQIHFAQLHSAILYDLSRDQRQSREERFGLRPAVRLDETDHELSSIEQFALSGPEHRIRFSHSRTHSEKNLEPTTPELCFFTVEGSQKRIGVWTKRRRHVGGL